MHGLTKDPERPRMEVVKQLFRCEAGVEDGQTVFYAYSSPIFTRPRGP